MDSKGQEKILPIWQPIGFSTHLITQRVGEKYGVKTSHTGTLDPMAEGVIIVLLDDERFNKYEYAGWQKSYKSEIVFGISTDSYDGLGVITETNFPEKIEERELKKVLKQFIGMYKQEVPPLSTKKIKGRHLHDYFRSGERVDLPEKHGRIYKLDLLSIKNVNSREIIKNIIKNVALVTGDFRQEEIIEQWKKMLTEKKLPVNIIVSEFETKTSKGIYIRSLVQDISKNLVTIGMANSIVRTKNGRHSKSECRTLEEIFGENYRKVYDFKSQYKFTMVK